MRRGESVDRGVQQKSGWKNKTRPRTEHGSELSDESSGGGTKVAAKKKSAWQTQIQNEKLTARKKKNAGRG
jgi:hypothetical protein